MRQKTLACLLATFESRLLPMVDHLDTAIGKLQGVVALDHRDDFSAGIVELHDAVAELSVIYKAWRDYDKTR